MFCSDCHGGNHPGTLRRERARAAKAKESQRASLMVTRFVASPAEGCCNGSVQTAYFVVSLISDSAMYQSIINMDTGYLMITRDL